MKKNIRKNSNKNRSIINANIYSVVEAVNSSIAPGEEKLVPLIVKHLIETHNAEVGH